MGGGHLEKAVTGERVKAIVMSIHTCTCIYSALHNKMLVLYV